MNNIEMNSNIDLNLNCPHCLNRSYSSKKSLNDHLRKYHAPSKDTKVPSQKVHSTEQKIKTEVVTPLKTMESSLKMIKDRLSSNQIKIEAKSPEVVTRVKSIDPPIKLTKDQQIQPNNLLQIETDISANEKGDWTQEEHVILLDQIKQQLPTNDHFRPYRMCETLDWSRVKVGNKSGEVCKDEWANLSIKIRHFRTMTELVADAKEYIQNPHALIYNKKGKHPDRPAKPLTPYFRFYSKKRAKYAGKNPNLSNTELTKLISKKFSNLDEKRKLKYMNAYNAEIEIWKQAMLIFKKNHPEHNNDEKFLSTCAKSVNIPPKTSSAMQIFIHDKTASHPHIDQTKKEIYDYYKNKWLNKLSDKKKIKYIRKAIEAKQIYDIEIAEYCATHPGFKPKKIKTFLNKAEQKLKDRFDGKPSKPPNNGYSLFTVETISQLTDIPNQERLTEISKRWKELGEHVRQAYNLKAEERFREYKQELHVYLAKLPEEERPSIEAEMEVANKKKSRTTTSPNVDRPMKPVAAVFLFIQEKMDEYRLEHPKMPDAELRRLLVKEFNCLPDKDRIKYKMMEEAEKERIAKESVQQISKRKRKLARENWLGEPTKPPNSGYMLFSKELQKELTHVKANERLQEIGKRWALLNDQEKGKYNKQRDKLWKKYNKELESFKKNLTPAELQIYEICNTSSNSKKKKPKNFLEEACLTTEEDVGTNDTEEDSVDASVSNHVPSNQDDDDDDDADDNDDDDDDDENDVKINGAENTSRNDEDIMTSSTSDDEEEDIEDDVKKFSNFHNNSNNHTLKTKEIYDDTSGEDNDDSSTNDSE